MNSDTPRFREFKHDVDTYVFEKGDIEDIVSYLTKKKAAIMKKHPLANRIRLDFNPYGCGKGEWNENRISLRVTRPETSEEVFQWEARRRKFEEAQEERDLAAFEKLKEKLGK